MKKSTKASLLSALIFPGAGHIYLKRYISATIFTGITLLVFSVLVSKAVEKALQITDKILIGDVQPKIGAISDLISSQPVGDDALLIEFASGTLIVVWLIGILDSYRVAKLQERSVAGKE